MSYALLKNTVTDINTNSISKRVTWREKSDNRVKVSFSKKDMSREKNVLHGLSIKDFEDSGFFPKY